MKHAMQRKAACYFLVLALCVSSLFGCTALNAFGDAVLIDDSKATAGTVNIAAANRNPFLASPAFYDQGVLRIWLSPGETTSPHVLDVIDNWPRVKALTSGGSLVLLDNGDVIDFQESPRYSMISELQYPFHVYDTEPYDGQALSEHFVPMLTDIALIKGHDDYHYAAISSDGDLYMWYREPPSDSPHYVETPDGIGAPAYIMGDVRDAAVGQLFSAAVTTDGSLYTWGSNAYGQLGNGTTEDSGKPVKILSNVVAIDAGQSFAAALTANGDLYTWGSCQDVTDDGLVDRLVPKKVLNNIVAFCTGMLHTLAVTRNGDLYAWGNNLSGNIGNGAHGYEWIGEPIKILGNVKAVSTSPSCNGGEISMAVTNDNSLYAWGGLNDSDNSDYWNDDMLAKWCAPVKIATLH